MKRAKVTSRLINRPGMHWFVWLTGFILSVNYCVADEERWQLKSTLQTDFQIYSDTSARSNSFNAGYFLSADYLDTGNITFGYNSTFVEFENNADDSGQFFYLSGQRHLYADSLPGKLSLRFDTYLGEESIKFRDSTASPTSSSGNAGKRAISLGSGIITETTDIDAYFLGSSFIDYRKTFYGDIGYARSEYDGSSSIKVNQITPSIGFGWNESYDWLQLRAYLIDIDQQTSSFDDDNFKALEAKYTHWYAEGGRSNLEFIRLSILSGERMLAVDPDAAAIYSIADIQQASVTGSMQWRFSANTKLLALIQYDQYEDANEKDYDSYLFYINFQFYH